MQQGRKAPPAPVLGKVDDVPKHTQTRAAGLAQQSGLSKYAADLLNLRRPVLRLLPNPTVFQQLLRHA